MTQKLLPALTGCFVFLCLSSGASAQVTASLVYSGPLCGTPAIPCYAGLQTQSFTFRIVNGNTASYPIMSVIIAPPSDLNVDACYFLYGPWGNSGRGTIALFGDSPQESNNNPWWQGWQDGADISNSQCTVKGSAMTKTVNGNDLIVTIPIVASSLMIGTYNIFISTGSWNFSAPDGIWKPIATLPPPPTTSVMPGSGTGMNATYDVTISSSGVGKSRALNRSLFFVN